MSSAVERSPDMVCPGAGVALVTAHTSTLTPPGPSVTSYVCCSNMINTSSSSSVCDAYSYSVGEINETG